ncbi:MAG TPA: DUF4129 domain-containing protein, partial [Pyrinomonadaceae bacterium]|nr:DUF4129 domain-containing protein [Pyrinomonadaceae bacterium]
KGFLEYQSSTSNYFESFQILAAGWWKDVQGHNGFETRAAAVGYAIAAFLIAIALLMGSWVAFKRVRALSLWSAFKKWFEPKRKRTVIEFYERMVKLLAERGLVREPQQTPLEFAFALGMSEAVKITEKYNKARFGEKGLSSTEVDEVENWLETLENDA